jgi:hypothetical protein
VTRIGFCPPLIESLFVLMFVCPSFAQTDLNTSSNIPISLVDIASIGRSTPQLDPIFFTVTIRACQGSFATTGSMTTARALHTATLLGTGKVLVAGGSDCCNWWSTAELYDPGAASFAPTGSMATARGMHTATLLSDSRVLIAGGSNTNGALATAEMYDPATGTFSSTGNMTTPRSAHTATLLASGKVLITGGDNGGFGSNAELYDPTTGLFTPTGSMTVPRAYHTATLLSNGRVLVTGGIGVPGLASAEVYDPSTGIFSLTGTMTTPRWLHTATLLSTGKVLVAGGFETSGGYNYSKASAELYDATNGFFFPTGSMTTPRASHTGTLLQNGKVLVAGGDNCQGIGGCAVESAAEIYDPSSGTSASTGSMTTARDRHAAALLLSGQVLVSGGADGNSFLASAETYCPAPGQGGTILVDTNLPSATFTITGPHDYSGGGTHQEFDNVPVGTYTITFGPVDGYVTPSPQTQTLTANGQINFTGTYIPASDSLIVSPATLSFAYQTGSGGSVQPQNLAISTSGRPLSFTISVTTVPAGGTWLSAAPRRAETPRMVTISVAPGLPPGTYSGQVIVSAIGATNSPVIVPVTLTVTAGAMTELLFPVREDQNYCLTGTCTPYTAHISAIFDHYMKTAYEDPHCEPYGGQAFGTIMDFKNESASGAQYHSPDGFGACTPPTLYGYSSPNEPTFLSGFNYHGNYDGTAYLYYDGHPGYDYKFDSGTAVYAAVSGCVSYHISAAGALASRYHVLTIIPFSEEPPGGQCDLTNIRSDTGYVVLYMHLSSYLDEYFDDNGQPVRCKPTRERPNQCVVQVPCDKCPKEGQWVSVTRTDEIGYTGNFSHGQWGGVANHLHFEIDLNPDPRPAPAPAGVPIDPYGWWSPSTDPYTTFKGAVNNWLWK